MFHYPTGYYYPPMQFIPAIEQHDNHVKRWRWLAYECERAKVVYRG